MKIVTTFFLLLILTVVATVQVHAACQTTTDADEVLEKTTIDTDVPQFLAGATIVVKLKSGKEVSMPVSRFKVVPRKQQVFATRVRQHDSTVCSAPDKELKRNRVSLMGGQGPQGGLDTTRTNTTATIESKVGAVGGLQYQRLLTDSLSVGGQVQTNDTLMLDVGLDF